MDLGQVGIKEVGAIHEGAATWLLGSVEVEQEEGWKVNEGKRQGTRKREKKESQKAWREVKEATATKVKVEVSMEDLEKSVDEWVEGIGDVMEFRKSTRKVSWGWGSRCVLK